MWVTALVSVITLFLAVGLVVFTVIVAQRQYDMTRENRHGLQALSAEDRRIRDAINTDVRNSISHVAADQRALRDSHAQDAYKFSTAHLRLRDGEGGGPVLSAGAVPGGDGSERGRGVTFRRGSGGDGASSAHAPADISAGRVWSADGVVIDEGCVETGKGGRVCTREKTDGLDIFGISAATGTGGNSGAAENQAAASAATDALLRRVYVHDALQARRLTADALVARGTPSQQHDPDGNKQTRFGQGDRNLIRGHTRVDGDMDVRGSAVLGDARSNEGENGDDDAEATKRTTFRGKKGNHIVGDTQLLGKMDVQNAAAFAGGTSSVDPSKDADGQPRKRTRLPDPKTGKNYVRGDTRVNGTMRVDGRVHAHGALHAPKARFANDTSKNNLTLEAGRSWNGGNEGLSTIAWNGATTEAGNVAYDASKRRWRLGVDQRGDRDRMFIDRYNSDSGDTWTPVTIEGNAVRVRGPLEVCEKDGSGCRAVALASES